MPTSSLDNVLADRLARAGQDVIAGVDLGPVNHLLATVPTAPLLDELEAVVQVLDGANPERSRRKVGIVGRLLGRDIVAQADPDPVDSRLRVHLVRAAEHAKALQSHLQRLDEANQALSQSAASLEAAVVQAEAELAFHGDRLACEPAELDRARRRIDYQSAITHSWVQTCAQLGVAARYARMLLDRHIQVRDLLVPLWQQQQAASALNTAVQHDGVTRLDGVFQEARRALADLQASAPTHSNQQPPAPAERESSP